MNTTQPPAASGLLCRAALYLHLAGILAYPNNELLEALRSGELGQMLRQWAIQLGPDEALAEGLDRFAGVAGEPASSSLSLAEEHTYLFARQVLAPPYETSYGNDRAYGRIRVLEDIAGYYQAFGLQVAQDSPDLPDHIGAELEFVGLLCAKEAYARETRLDDSAEACRVARTRFLNTHLASWLPRFVQRLQAHARLSFYPAAGSLALALVQSEPGLDPVDPPLASEESEAWDDESFCEAACHRAEPGSAAASR